MLGVVQVIPYVQLGGLAIWSLVCAYVGIKTSGRLTPWRAFWATILPPIALIVLVMLLGCCVGVAVSAIGGQR
jgi:hypothetical protein